MRTIPDISSLLKPIDDTVDDFIIVLFNSYEFSELEGKIWSLPVRMGGMGITIPKKMADEQYANSRKINEQLTTKVRNQQAIFESVELSVSKAKAEVKMQKEANELGTCEKAKILEAIQEKGASSWLNALPNQNTRLRSA